MVALGAPLLVVALRVYREPQRLVVHKLLCIYLPFEGC